MRNNADLIERKLQEKRIIDNYIKKSREDKESKAKKNDKFTFSNIVDDISDLVYNKTKASYNQIQIKVIQNLAFLFSYGGFNKYFNNAFYVYDLSPSGRGKSSLVRHLRNLLLRPVIKELEAKQKKENEKAKEEKRKIRAYKAIHTEAITPEALYMYFINNPVQMVELGELGKQIEKDHRVLDFILNAYGSNFINIPSHKNLLEDVDKHIVENTALFVYGDTNLEYLGIKNFFKNLKGGLLNRGLIAFNRGIRAFEDLPRSYNLDLEDIRTYNLIARNIIDFSKQKAKPIKETFTNNSLYLAFAKDIYNKEIELDLNKNPFKNLYSRVMENFNSVLLTLHLIECYQEGELIEEIKNSTIEKAIEYIRVFVENYEELVDEILNYQEKQEEILEEKVINRLKELLSKKDTCSLREIYKPLKISKSKAEIIIKNHIQEYGNYRLFKKGNQLLVSFFKG